MIAIKSIRSKDTPYTETGQINDLRWVTLYRDGDTYINTSNIFKCKDYFNDMVAARRKVFFRAYGFHNEKPLNDEGQYIFVTNLTSQFLHNLELINKWVRETNKDGQVAAVVHIDDAEFTSQTGQHYKGHILMMPAWIMETTYYVSLITWMIRIANFDKKYRGPRSMAKDAHLYGDCPFRNVFAKVLLNGVNHPAKDRKVWYYNFAVNSVDRMVQSAESIHHMGVDSWMGALNMKPAECA